MFVGDDSTDLNRSQARTRQSEFVDVGSPTPTIFDPLQFGVLLGNLSTRCLNLQVR